MEMGLLFQSGQEPPHTSDPTSINARLLQGDFQANRYQQAVVFDHGH
jgi:hypothetical protein